MADTSAVSEQPNRIAATENDEFPQVAVPEEAMKESTAACPTMTRDWAFCRFLTKTVVKCDCLAW